MDLVVPRLPAEAGSGEQHVVAPNRPAATTAAPAVVMSQGPAVPAAATRPSAVPKATEQTPSPTNPAIMICGSRASMAARPLICTWLAE